MKVPRLRGQARRALGIAKMFFGRMVGSSRLEAAGVIDELMGRLDRNGREPPTPHVRNHPQRNKEHDLNR